MTNQLPVIITLVLILWLASLVIIVWIFSATQRQINCSNQLIQNFIQSNEQINKKQQQTEIINTDRLKSIENRQINNIKENNKKIDKYILSNNLIKEGNIKLQQEQKKYMSDIVVAIDEIVNKSQQIKHIENTVKKFDKNSKIYGKSLNNINNRMNKIISNQKTIENNIPLSHEKLIAVINNAIKHKLNDRTNLLMTKTEKDNFTDTMAKLINFLSKSDYKKIFGESLNKINDKISKIYTTLLKLNKSKPDPKKTGNNNKTIIDGKKLKNDVKRINKCLNTILTKINIIKSNTDGESMKGVLSDSHKDINKSLIAINNTINNAILTSGYSKTNEEIDAKDIINTKELLKRKKLSNEPKQIKANSTSISTCLGDASNANSINKPAGDKLINLSPQSNNEDQLNNIITTSLDELANKYNNMKYINDELFNSQMLIENILNEQMNGLRLKMNNQAQYECLLRQENNYSIFAGNILSDLRNDIINLKYGLQEKINIIATLFGKQYMFEKIIIEANYLIYEYDNNDDEIVASYGY